MASASPTQRLAYIDWMRGLACVLMFQTHCYDSWLSPAARQGKFFMYSQLGGTFPAPLFLFLAGISFALVTQKLWHKNLLPAQIARITIRRGAEIFGFGLLFRLQEYVIAWGWAPLSDLLRVDILNTIGLSMMLMGLLCWLVLSLRAAKATMILGSAATALLISLLTPPLWTTWRPDWLPWPIESYINGVHNFGVPQAWLFPVFPWAAFAFVGLAAGFILQSGWGREREGLTFLIAGVAGILLVAAARWLDHQPRQLYGVYDYWHTSPNFFLIRVGMLLIILCRVLCLVPLGRGRVGIQSADSTRPGFIAGVLGAFGIRLWTRLHSSEAQRQHSYCVRGIAHHLSRYARARLRSYPIERSRSRNARVVLASSQCELNVARTLSSATSHLRYVRGASRGRSICAS